MKVFKTSTYRRNALRLYLLTALLITALLSSCISDSELYGPQQRTGDITISLRIIEQSYETRSVSRPILDGEEVIFHTGDLYLVNAAGLVVQHYRILNDNSALNTAVTPHTIGRLQLMACDDPDLDPLCGGIILRGVPNTVVRAYIIGNTPDNRTSGNMTTYVGARMIDITSQHDPLGATGINLFGWSLIGTEVTQGDDSVFPFNIEVNPTVARFEISNITGEGDAQSGIQSFTVAGIFMDNYHAQAHVNGRGFSAARVNNGDNAALFVNNTSQFPNDRMGAIHHWGTWASNNRIATPDGNNVWGFQLFAAERGQTAITVVPPYIVIRLSEVVVNNRLGGTTTLTNQFVTVNAFHFFQNSSAQHLESITAGYVYRINEIRFTEFDLRDAPNRHTIGAEVSIDVCFWCENDVRHNNMLRQAPLGAIQTCPGLAIRLDFTGAVASANTPAIMYQWQRTATPDDEASWVNAHMNPQPSGSVTMVVPVGHYLRRIAIWGAVRDTTNHVQVRTFDRVYDPRWTPTTDPGVVLAGTPGIRWATRNVGLPGQFASHFSDPGKFYMWARPTAWSLTDNPRQAWIPGNPNPVPMVWRGDSRITGNEGALGTLWSNIVCPPGWRLPTSEEFSALVAFALLNRPPSAPVNSAHNTDWLPFGNREWGCYPGRLIGPAGGNVNNHNPHTSIFLPGVGMRHERYGDLRDELYPTHGSYWSSTRRPRDTPILLLSGEWSYYYNSARRLRISDVTIQTDWTYWGWGNLIRCVQDI